MHVGKSLIQLALKRQMHGRRGFEMLQPAEVDVMVIVKR